jgi:hypothetical protein
MKFFEIVTPFHTIGLGYLYINSSMLVNMLMLFFYQAIAYPRSAKISCRPKPTVN